MSQFDVYENPSRATRNTFPYLVDVQSPYLDDLETRIVIPLVKATLTNGASMKRLTPVVTFEEEKLLVLTPQISAISKKRLSDPVGTLAHMRDDLLNALDFAISGI